MSFFTHTRCVFCGHEMPETERETCSDKCAEDLAYHRAQDAAALRHYGLRLVAEKPAPPIPFET